MFHAKPNLPLREEVVEEVKKIADTPKGGKEGGKSGVLKSSPIAEEGLQAGGGLPASKGKKSKKGKKSESKGEASSSPSSEEFLQTAKDRSRQQQGVVLDIVSSLTWSEFESLYKLMQKMTYGKSSEGDAALTFVELTTKKQNKLLQLVSPLPPNTPHIHTLLSRPLLSAPFLLLLASHQRDLSRSRRRRKYLAMKRSG
jgi:hypothetical protein